MSWDKKIILVLLSALLAVSLVSGIEFKNAILLNETGFTPFAINLNDSLQVTGDINVSLIAGTNFIGYSSKNSINVNDVIVYNATDDSKSYQDAITAGWFDGINTSIGTTTGKEATTLSKYGAYWTTSITATKLQFTGVGGSDITQSINYIDLLFYNGSTYLNGTDVANAGWLVTSLITTFEDNDFKSVCEKTGIGGCDFTVLNTWQGYTINTQKPNIYLLFENKTIPPPDTLIIRLQTAKPKSLGSELVTDGDFTGDGSDWTLGTGWNYIGSPNFFLLYSGFPPATASVSQSIGIVAGKEYRLTYNLSLMFKPDIDITPSVGGVTLIKRTASASNVQYTEDFTATSTANLDFSATTRHGSASVRVHYVSVKEILPNEIKIELTENTKFGDIVNAIKVLWKIWIT